MDPRRVDPRRVDPRRVDPRRVEPRALVRRLRRAPRWRDSLYESTTLKGSAEGDFIGVLQVTADRQPAGQPRDRNP